MTLCNSDHSGLPPSSSQELPAGYILGEFTITSILGAGGFGITYLANDRSLNRQVVIKENLPSQIAFRDTYRMTVLPRQSGDDSNVYEWSIQSFLKEARMLASLDHPNIVKIIRTFSGNGTAYFVMPFIQGDSLDQIAKTAHSQGQPLTENYIREILSQLLNALEYLHSKQILHRDIKPANVLIVNGTQPLLIDFGCARDQSGSKSLTVIESAGYTPFEQMQSHGNVGPWSDLYALGAAMYKIITGETPAKCADRIRRDPVSKLADHSVWKNFYSSELLSSIDKAMSPFEESRFQSSEEWLTHLNASSHFSLPPLPPLPGNEEIQLPPLPSSYQNTSDQPEYPFLPPPPTPDENGNSHPFIPSSSPGVSKTLIISILSIASALVIGLTIYLVKTEQNEQMIASVDNSNNEEKIPLQDTPSNTKTAEDTGKELPLKPTPEVSTGTNPIEPDKSIAQSDKAPSPSDKVPPLVRRTPVSAEEWFEEGNMYREGNVVFNIQVDVKKSFECYKTAATLGHEKAQLYLADAYYNGEGTTVNHDEAVRLFEKCAEKGMPEAQYYLANSYFTGKGKPQDDTKGMHWLELSAQKLPEAKCELARLYYEARPPRVDEAISLLESATKDQGSSQGLLLLANLYYASPEEELNRKVIPLLQIEAEQGNPSAQSIIARCYWEGKGTLKNIDKAVTWFERAATNGDIDSMYMMGLHYQRKHQIEKAKGYYKQAADNGYESAAKTLKLMK